MLMQIDFEINPDELSEEQRALYDCIGDESYKKLVAEFGGTTLYIYKADTLGRSVRDEKICNDFNGANYKYLAAKYNLTERTIRMIVLPELQKLRDEPHEGQMSWKDV